MWIRLLKASLAVFREAGATRGCLWGRAMATYFLALTASQVAEFLHDHRIRREWFGEERHGMLPLKKVVEDAMTAHVQALLKKPAAIISVTLSLSYFHQLIETGMMVPVLHVGGYRLYADLHFDGEDVLSVEVSQVI